MKNGFYKREGIGKEAQAELATLYQDAKAKQRAMEGDKGYGAFNEAVEKYNAQAEILGLEPFYTPGEMELNFEGTGGVPLDDIGTAGEARQSKGKKKLDDLSLELGY